MVMPLSWHGAVMGIIFYPVNGIFGRLANYQECWTDILLTILILLIGLLLRLMPLELLNRSWLGDFSWSEDDLGSDFMATGCGSIG